MRHVNLVVRECVDGTGLFPSGDLLKNVHTKSADGTCAAHRSSAHSHHPVKPTLILHASHTNDHDVPGVGTLIQQAPERSHIAQRQRMQSRAGQPTDAGSGLTLQRRRQILAQHQTGAECIRARDEVDHTALARFGRFRGPQCLCDHGELRAVCVRRQFDADSRDAVIRGHAPAIRRLGVRNGFEVLCQPRGVVGGRRRIGDVGTRQVDFHREAEVFVHLGCVGDERVRHGDFVGRARHAEDEGLFRRRDGGPEVALPDDLVDVAQVFGQRQRGVA